MKKFDLLRNSITGALMGTMLLTVSGVALADNSRNTNVQAPTLMVQQKAGNNYFQNVTMQESTISTASLQKVLGKMVANNTISQSQAATIGKYFKSQTTCTRAVQIINDLVSRKIITAHQGYILKNSIVPKNLPLHNSSTYQVQRQDINKNALKPAVNDYTSIHKQADAVVKIIHPVAVK